MSSTRDSASGRSGAYRDSGHHHAPTYHGAARPDPQLRGGFQRPRGLPEDLALRPRLGVRLCIDSPRLSRELHSAGCLGPGLPADRQAPGASARDLDPRRVP
jgi:hypothetical protein